MACKQVRRPPMALLSQQGELEIHSDHGGKALILHGLPHKEPIANYGPFVMNTREEIEQAFRDYQQGRFANN